MAKKVVYKDAEGVRNSIKIEFYQFLETKKILFAVKDKEEEMDEFLDVYKKAQEEGKGERKPLMELVEDESGNTVLQEIVTEEQKELQKIDESGTKKDKPTYKKISFNIVDGEKKWVFRGTRVSEHHREPDGNEMVVLDYRSLVEF